jgi:DNA primase
MQIEKRGYGQDFIDSVKSASNIVDIARSYLTLKQKGQDFWACCPFHHEKTPSFKVSGTHQAYYCFGCKASGNVIGLVMQLESLSWREALEFLAKRANIEIPKLAAGDDSAKNARKKERILSALIIARDYYCKNLRRPPNRVALEYLHNRGIDDELINLFHIGYSDSWQGVVDELKRAGFTEQEMKDAGIAAMNDKGRVWDAQYERITFAVHDIYGNCIGFTGRTMSADPNLAKYKNTAETMVFNKSNILYGIDVMKSKSRESAMNGLIVVEGNVDEISMVKNGFGNTVACMGTAMTTFHAKMFSRFTDQIYLCLDGDAAGRRAALRSVKILTDEGLSVRVAVIPDNLDPDDYLRKYGADAMKNLIKSALPAVDFRLDCLAVDGNVTDNIGKSNYIKGALEILKEFDTPAEWELYLPKIASVAGVPVQSLRESMGGKKPAQPKNSVSFDITSTSGGGASAYEKAQVFVTAAIVNKKDYVTPGDAPPRLSNVLYDKLCRMALENYEKWNLGQMYNELDEEDLKKIKSVVDYEFIGSNEEQKETWQKDLIFLVNAGIDRQIEELRSKGLGPVEFAKEKQKLLKGKRK